MRIVITIKKNKDRCKEYYLSVDKGINEEDILHIIGMLTDSLNTRFSLKAVIIGLLKNFKK